MAAGQTTITYGDLKLLNCLTREFRQEAVYDDSGTDLLFFRFTIRVVGYLTGRTYASTTPSVHVLPTPGGDSAAAHVLNMRYLLAPRKPFEMRLGASFTGTGTITGGTVLLNASPFSSAADTSNASYKDLNNGPKARLISATQISADNLIRAEFEFEVCKLECDSLGNCPNSSGVLNNRWSVTDVIDSNFMTTRTFTGRLRTVSSKINANSFRNFVVPPLQPGMRRESMRFQVTEDGLTLAYDITDREVAFAPPAPATTWRMTYTDRAERELLGRVISELHITLGGDRLVDKKLLIQMAAKIAESRLMSVIPGRSYVQQMSITDEYSDNSSLIHLHAVSLRHVTSEEAGKVINHLIAVTQNLGKPIDTNDLTTVVSNYNRDLSRGSRTGESLEVEGPIKMVGAFAAYLQSPCSADHKIFSAENSGQSATPEQRTPAAIEASIVTEIPAGELPDLSLGHTEAMYNFFQMESKYVVHGITAHLPVAVPTSLGGEPLPGQPESVCVNLAPPLTRRVVKVVAERLEKWPVIPNPLRSFVQNGVTHRLLRKAVQPGTGEMTPDNKRLYRISAEYHYALDRDPTNGGTITAGVNSWEGSDALYSLVFQNVSEEELAGGSRL